MRRRKFIQFLGLTALSSGIIPLNSFGKSNKEPIRKRQDDMLWFEELMGFKEESPQQVRANIICNGTSLQSKVNNKTYEAGTLSTPSLAELRTQFTQTRFIEGQLILKECVGDVQDLHLDPENSHAFFQVASQFNLLEMTSPKVTPEAGVGIYAYDHTQGPACAIACGAGTIFRNYFVDVNGKKGQTKEQQIDCLSDLGEVLGNFKERLWTMENGYALPSKKGLIKIQKKLKAISPAQKEVLKGYLRIGWHQNTEVTLKHTQQLVSQAYCSALPVAYSNLPVELWEEFASLVLEASYECCLLAAALNYQRTGQKRVFLTLIGGGVFGNDPSWIFNALSIAIQKVEKLPLELNIVSYGQSNPAVLEFIQSKAWMNK